VQQGRGEQVLAAYPAALPVPCRRSVWHPVWVADLAQLPDTSKNLQSHARHISSRLYEKQGLGGACSNRQHKTSVLNFCLEDRAL
jgi:hypothetical protein